MFDQFPKTRPPLPPKIERIYKETYAINRKGQSPASSLSQKVESWLHYQVAKDVLGKRNYDGATLELGAGTLNQLDYEPPSAAYDVVEPFSELFQGSTGLHRVRSVYGDISEVPLSSRYDRITSVAVLEHLCDLPRAVAMSGLLLADEGSFRASIPNEGSLVWKLGWKLTTGLEFRLRHGLDYGFLMRHEHVNSADEIEQTLAYFFQSIECRLMGLTRRLALYRYYECRQPDISRCKRFLLAT